MYTSRVPYRHLQGPAESIPVALSHARYAFVTERRISHERMPAFSVLFTHSALSSTSFGWTGLSTAPGTALAETVANLHLRRTCDRLEDIAGYAG